MSFPRCCSLL